MAHLGHDAALRQHPVQPLLYAVPTHVLHRRATHAEPFGHLPIWKTRTVFGLIGQQEQLCVAALVGRHAPGMRQRVQSLPLLWRQPNYIQLLHAKFLNMLSPPVDTLP